MTAWPTPPAVGPRLLVAGVAGAYALGAPLPAAVAVTLGASWVLLHGDRRAARGAGGAVLGIAVATMAVTPWWLVWLTDLAPSDAIGLAAALVVRLSAVLVVGLALGAVLPVRAWLVALRRFPRGALAVGLTLRLAPDVARDVEDVRRAQRARGLLIQGGPRRAHPLVAPVVTRAVERADRLGRALLLAGWGTRAARPAVSPRYGAQDVFLVAAAAVGVAWLLAAYAWS